MIAQNVAASAGAAREQSQPALLSWTNRIVEGGALFLLVFTPLAFGTVQPWSEAVAGVVILGMAVVWVIGMVRQWELRVELPPGWLPAALFLGLVFLQLMPLPIALVRLISPLSGEASRTASAYAAAGWSFAPLSMDPHATWREGAKLLLVALFFLVLYNTHRTPKQIDRVIWTMIVMGSLIAVFGIVQRMTWTGRFYWIGPEALGSTYSFGPFVNRVHFVGLTVVAVPMALAIWLSRKPGLSRRRSERRRTWKDRLYRWSTGEAGAVRLVPFLILLMGGAALVSSSRGGIISLLAALLCMVGLVSRGGAGRGLTARVAVVAALVVLAGAWIGGEVLYGTIERLADEINRPDESWRLRIWASALALWQQSPVLGTGLATFGAAFPIVRSLPAPVAFTHAESDWVQLLTDTGLLGLAFALAAVGAVGAALLERFRRPCSPHARPFALAGFVALLGAALQGVANFNLAVTSGLVYLATALVVALRKAD